MDVVGLLELLAGDVCELGFGDERLGFGADELLLEGDNLGRFWLLVLELLDLILDLWARVLAWQLFSIGQAHNPHLLLVCAARLH